MPVYCINLKPEFNTCNLRMIDESKRINEYKQANINWQMNACITCLGHVEFDFYPFLILFNLGIVTSGSKFHFVTASDHDGFFP